MPSESGRSEQPARAGGLAKRLILLVLLLTIAGLIYWRFGGLLSLDYLAAQETQLRSWQEQAPLLAAAVALAIYIAVTGLSLPGATAMTLVCGWYFGFWEGLLIVSFGSTAGAVLAFLFSRYLLRDWIQKKLHERLGRINDAFEREGAFYLFSLRLVPIFPFFAVNTLMGLTKIRAVTFWWVSQIGMLPGTTAYVYAGSTIPSLKTIADEGVGRVLSPQMLLAFALIGLLPLVIKKMLKLLRRSNG